MTKSLGINRPRHVWTALDEQILRVGYPDLPTKQIAHDLRISEKMVFRKAKSLGLKKSEAYLASDMSGRIQRGRQDPRLVATQFKKGIEPWNKGTNYKAGGRSAETRFKKGRRPEEARNYLPIGSLRVTRDGYLERKMTDDQSLAPTRRWIAVHRLVWEAANGPIPKGDMVVFKPGMKTIVEAEVTVDRLECISRAENARRNVPTVKNPEVAKLIQLKGAITRQVNRINREAKEKETNP